MEDLDAPIAVRAVSNVFIRLDVFRGCQATLQYHLVAVTRIGKNRRMGHEETLASASSGYKAMQVVEGTMACLAAVASMTAVAIMAPVVIITAIMRGGRVYRDAARRCI
jgi:hypothetical protein